MAAMMAAGFQFGGAGSAHSRPGIDPMLTGGGGPPRQLAGYPGNHYPASGLTSLDHPASHHSHLQHSGAYPHGRHGDHPQQTSLGSPDSSCSHSNGVETGETWSGQSGSSTAANAAALLAGMLHQTGSWKGDLSDSDRDMFERLSECLLRLREPFSPDDQLESGTAETLEQAYNRMDTCIRRIIRVAKMIPYFVDIGKDAQIYILKANIYGLIILYSSFFFEKDISKLCYPVKAADGRITRITVSMLEDISVTVPVAAFATNSLPPGLSSSSSANHPQHTASEGNNNDSSTSPMSNGNVASGNDKNSVIREDFELYKRNTLAAFTELQDLANGDDYIRVCMLALKLFSTECLPNHLRPTVDQAQSAYLVFLQRYLTWRLGELQTARLYPRLLMAFIDIRTLEIRMTGFAKLLCLDGLSPLMREVCSHR